MKSWFFRNLGAGGILASGLILTGVAHADPQNPSPAPAIPAKPAEEPVITAYSPGMQEVFKLAQAKVSKDVLVAYINSSAVGYHPTADEIVYLNDLGVSDEVITALLKKGGQPSGAPTQPLVPSPSSGAPVVPNVTPGVPVPSSPAPVVPGSPLANSAPTVPNAPVIGSPPPSDAVSPTFSTALSPYGSWVSVPDYGVCWQPAVAMANPDWRPYMDNGHWIYTDSGWYWQSDYTWGWAPFHYGRWHRHPGLGWVWVPGNSWGPAWVSWRYTDGYCGWAPLPPAARFEAGVGFVFNGVHVGADFDFGLGDSFYAFVPVGHFCDPYPWRFRVGFAESHDLFRRSVVHNRYDYRGGVVINEGFGRDRVAVAAHIDIPLVRIRESHEFVRPGYRRGEEVHVYRPRVEGHGDRR